MQAGDTLILDSEALAAPEPVAHEPVAYVPARQRAAWVLALALVLGLVGVAAILTFGVPGYSPRSLLRPMPAAAPGKPVMPFDPEKMSASDPSVLEALTPDEAVAENMARPESTLPNPAARPLIAPQTDVESYQRSLDCMTAAIYYEAAFEPVDGQRAVAQVVLNRVRHPIYPRTVCGVVFQGSERRTGCQFTFTCDGSLMRVPNQAIWDRVRKVAAEALAGYVYRPVGLSTHYHADYVVPYWASSLVKLSTIGRHIFYRIEGGYGSPPAFARLYEGHEPQSFERTPAGRFVLLNAAGEPLLAGLDPAPAPSARPLLDGTGRILADSGSTPVTANLAAGGAKPHAASGTTSATASPASAPAAASLASRRWIIGMDGATRSTQPAATNADAGAPAGPAR